MKLSKMRIGFLVLISVFLVGFVMTGHSEAAKKKKRFKFTRITDVAYSDQWNNFQAMISGDGKKVLYSHLSTENEQNRWGLYLVNADGTDSRLIVPYKEETITPLSISYMEAGCFILRGMGIMSGTAQEKHPGSSHANHLFLLILIYV